MRRRTKWNPASFSPQESEFVAGRELTVKLVALAYGAPVMLLGQGDRSTVQARRALYQDALLPLASLIDSTFNLSLVPDFNDPDVFIETEPAEMVRGDIDLQTDVLARSIESGLLTANEARALINRPPLNDGNALLRPGSREALPVAAPKSDEPNEC
jgi:HK97 family phage portal protein